MTNNPDAMPSTTALTLEERSHLAARPDWTPIWESVERLFADADETLKRIDEAMTCGS